MNTTEAKAMPARTLEPEYAPRPSRGGILQSCYDALSEAPMAMSAAEVTVRVAELLKDSPLMVAREPITIERVAQIMTIDARQTGRFVVSEEGYWDIAPAFKYKPRIRAANGEPTEEQKAQMWRPARLPAKSAVIGTVSNVELAIRKRLVISFVVGLIGGMGIGAGVVLLSIA